MCSISHSIAHEVTIPEVEFNKNEIYGNVGSGGLYFTFITGNLKGDVPPLSGT